VGELLPLVKRTEAALSEFMRLGGKGSLLI